MIISNLECSFFKSSVKGSSALIDTIMYFNCGNGCFQAKFRSMVEENKQMGTRIEGEVQSGREDVAALRAELGESGSRRGESLASATTPTPASTPASATSLTPASATPSSASSAAGSASTGSASDEPDRKAGDEAKSTADAQVPTKWSLNLSPLNQIVRPPSPKAGTSTSEGEYLCLLQSTERASKAILTKNITRR